MSDLIDRQAAIDVIEKGAYRHTYLDQIVDIIRDLPSVQQWIPCGERLPDDDVEVFVYLFERPVPYIAWVEDCRWYTEDFEVEKEYYPTAWMPLPEPYKGE